MTRIVLVILAFFIPYSQAFEPAETYARDSLETTVGMIAGWTVPMVDYPDGSVAEVVDFIERMGDIPKEFRVQFTLEGFSDLAGLRVKLVEKDISKLAALSKIAEQIDADIEIKRGKVILRKRPE